MSTNRDNGYFTDSIDDPEGIEAAYNAMFTDDEEPELYIEEQRALFRYDWFEYEELRDN